MELRNRIRQKARNLYLKYGVRSVTMDEIASQLGVSKKTIYQSFSDKNELVDAVMLDILHYNKESCINCRESAKNAVHEVLLAVQNMSEMMANMDPSAMYDIERGYPNSYKKFVAFKYDFLYHIMVKNLEWGISEGLYRKDVDVEIITKMRLESLNIPFNEKLFPKGRFTLSAVHKELIMFYLYGITTAKGRELIKKYEQE